VGFAWLGNHDHGHLVPFWRDWDSSFSCPWKRRRNVVQDCCHEGGILQELENSVGDAVWPWSAAVAGGVEEGVQGVQ